MRQDDPQRALDARIVTYYSELFDEAARLTTRSAQGALELLRTIEIATVHGLGRRLIDIGGGPGSVARAFVDAGHEVLLIDPVPSHVEQARRGGLRASVGDARRLAFSDGEFDAALLLGPLYHLAGRGDRLLALREAARVVRPGGLVLASGISRLARLAASTLGPGTPALDDDSVIGLLRRGEAPSGLRFPAGHFHGATELADEVREAGLVLREVVGIEGPGGLVLESLESAGPDLVDAALRLARAAPAGLQDLSAHLLAVAEVGQAR